MTETATVWTMIFWLFTGSGDGTVVVQTLDFATKDRCVAAAEFLRTKDNWGNKIGAVCVQRDLP